MIDTLDPEARAVLGLDGLSVGDALGEQFFGPIADAVRRIEARELPPGPWRYTDDTEMAISVTEVLLERGRLDPDLLARRFARRYDPSRGYGMAAHGLLEAYGRGVPWTVGAPEIFGGARSFGNGAAMRVAPLGAYLADDLDAVVAQAELSARVTHAHAEGVAGAVAVAVAAAVAYRQSVASELDPEGLFEGVLFRTPQSVTRERIEEAAALSAVTLPEEVARQVGSGQEISAQDTVPFVIWCAAHHLDDYETAFWHTVRGLDDRDTTCAMVGGIVALSARSIPGPWLALREPLPDLR